MATSFVVRVAGVPERNSVTHDEDPRPRAIRLRTASTVAREPSILAVFVRPMRLVVVFRDPLLVDCLGLLPTLSFRPVIVSKPPLYIELVFYQVLPALALFLSASTKLRTEI
jgi:hypothetical protein